MPSLSVTPANSSVALSGNFTIVMADAGPVGTDESAGQTRHWLVNGATVSNGRFCLIYKLLDNSHSLYIGSAPLTVSTTDAVAITKYGGPAPPAGSGPHRYVPK